MSKVVIRTHYSVGGKSVGGGFTKSIVDSKERTKEYRKDSAMGIHHGM